MEQERFDNLTDEEVYESIKFNPHPIKQRRKRIKWALVAFFLIALLVIGFEIAPVARTGNFTYYLDSLFR